jgi:hypothetical protein
MTRLTSLLERQPPILWALLAYAVAILVIAPWGNFPLNDDWCYAHVAKQLAETGRFRVDCPVAPSLLGQSLLAAVLIKSFGFSHTLLRALTIALGAVTLWTLSRLLAYAKVRRGLQTLTLLTLATSPLYAYLSLTFMTEIYGWGLGLLGAVLWMRVRAKADGGSAAPSWAVTLGTAAIVGATFWTRQFAVVIFPALIGAYLLELALERDRAGLRRAAPRIGAAVLVFCAVVLSYFPFASATGGLRKQMSGPASGMLDPLPRVWVLHLGTFLVYMALFLCPLFSLLRFKGSARRRAAIGGVFVGLAVSASLVQILNGTSSDYRHGEFLHRSFPFMGNLIHPGGLGPITLSDVYVFDEPQPRLPDAFWLGVEIVAIVLSARWVPFLAGVGGALGKGIRREVFSFGLLLTLGSLILVWQAYATQVFDRYYFPCVLGVALMLAALLEARLGEVRRRALLEGAAWLVPLAAFTVLGLHDYFRWNETRWQLFDQAVARGVDPARIDGGYEVDGWILKEPPAGAGRQACIGGRCHCDGVWWRCEDASYRIGMNVGHGYEEVRRLEPEHWLAGSALVLSKRAVSVESRRSGP